MDRKPRQNGDSTKIGKKRKDKAHEAGGILFVGSILVCGALGTILLDPRYSGIVWVLGVGVGFILMALSILKAK